MNAERAYQFDETYREEVTLADGSRALLRLVRPGDAKLLKEGFERLSPQSRYSRFFGVKASLSMAELRYLTEVDGVDHFAIGAVRFPIGKDEEPLGIARFVRLHDEPEVAEPALTVVDEAQGKGLGTVMLQRLAEAAMERSVRRFRSEFLADNAPIRQLVTDYARQLGSEVVEESDGGIVRVELPLVHVTGEHRVVPAAKGSPLRRLLAELAAGVIGVRLRLLWPGGRDDADEQEADPEPDEGSTSGE